MDNPKPLKTINANFIQDFAEYCVKDLIRKGYSSSIIIRPEDTIRSFYNALFKTLIPKPRNILIAKEFQCPAEYEAGLDLLKEKIMSGGDLNSHLSKRINNMDININKGKKNAHDSMLNDWMIYHLHLGTKTDIKEPFIDRTKSVLFAMFDDETAYFINTYMHGKGYKPWIKKEVLKIINNNWTYLQTTLNGIKGEDFDEQAINTLRENNANYIIDINGKAILPAGGGSMSSGISFEVMRKSDDVIARLKDYEMLIKHNADNIANQIENQLQIKMPSILDIQLCVKDGKYHLLETNTRCIINITNFVLDEQYIPICPTSLI